MFSHSRGHKSPEYLALIDIGSGTIGIGIVAFEESSPNPVFIYTHRIMLRVPTTQTKKSLDPRRVSEALLSASLILSQEGSNALRDHNPKGKIHKLCIMCSSPWSETITKRVVYKNDTPFTVSHPLIDDLIQTAEQEMFGSLKELSEEQQDNLTVVEKTTLDVHLNEYAVQNPIGMTATSVSLSHVTGLIPKEIVAAIHNVHDKLFPSSELHVHTTLFTLFLVVRDLFPQNHSLCLIDITGEATELATIEDGVLIQNKTILYGSGTFLRDIMEKTGKPESDILTLIRAYGDKTAVTPPDLKKYIDTYEEALTALFTSVFEKNFIPPNIVLTTHSPYEKLCTDMVQKSYEKATKNKPLIMGMKNKIIDAIAGGPDNDIYLTILARFFHKLKDIDEQKNS